jgi:general secretion pathway protein K
MKQKFSGTALLSALFIMALITIVATSIMNNTHTILVQAKIHEGGDELFLASQAVTFWAMHELQTKEEPKKKFPAKLKNLTPGVTISGSITDLQTKFNVNSLQSDKFDIMFYGILKLLDLQPEAMENIMIGVKNWVNTNKLDHGKIRMMRFYIDQDPSYWPAYRPMAHISELRMVFGVNAAIYTDLEPYITALPDITPININNASPEILRTLGNGLSNDQVNTITALTPIKSNENNAKLVRLLNLYNIDKETVTTHSNYFLCTASATKNHKSITRYTILYRDQTRQNNIVKIISDSINTP